MGLKDTAIILQRSELWIMTNDIAIDIAIGNIMTCGAFNQGMIRSKS